MRIYQNAYRAFNADGRYYINKEDVYSLRIDGHLADLDKCSATLRKRVEYIAKLLTEGDFTVSHGIAHSVSKDKLIDVSQKAYDDEEL